MIALLKIFLTLTLAFALPVEAGNSLSQLEGRWVGFSKAIYAIFGDLSVGYNELDFQIQGKRKFSVLDELDGYVVLELAVPLECGRFVRLGPIVKEGNMFAGYMEFAVFDTKEKSLAPRYFN